MIPLSIYVKKWKSIVITIGDYFGLYLRLISSALCMVFSWTVTYCVFYPRDLHALYDIVLISAPQAIFLTLVIIVTHKGYNILPSYQYYLYSCHTWNFTWLDIVCVCVCVCLQLFGGFLIALSSLPEWLQWIKYLSLFRYSLEVWTDLDHSYTPIICSIPAW